MLNVKTVLEYQSVDMELRKLEREVEQSEYAQAAKKAQDVFKDAKESVLKCDREAKAIVEYLNKAKSFYSKLYPKIEEQNAKLKSDDNENRDMDKFKSDLNELNDRFSKIEKDLAQLMKNADDQVVEYKNANKKGATARSEYQKNAESQKELKVAKGSAIDSLRLKLKGLESSLEPAILERYRALRHDYPQPSFAPFVPLEAPNKCSGCRMEMSLGNINKLKEKGYIECESCRRIIYSN